MTDYREILRLGSQNYSQRSIAQAAGCSRNTVEKVLRTASAKGVQWPLENDVSNRDLEELLFPEKYRNASMYTEPDYPYIHQELAKPGVTMALLWEEYCRKCHEAGETPYMSTQFGDKYRRWARVTKATMRIQHKPGDAIQVDWAGDTLPVYDPITGEQSNTHLFVAVLPCSCCTYAEACEDMKTGNWLTCHVHAFQYFGGVTRLLIPDNCKTATTANTRYETVLNRSCQELAEYYGTAIVPARVRKPQDKSVAEASVRFAETWIIAALRDRKFFSIREVNEAIAEKLEELNSRPFQRMAGTRRSAYLEEEKQYMLPLPAVSFEAAVWSVAKVSKDVCCKESYPELPKNDDVDAFVIADKLRFGRIGKEVYMDDYRYKALQTLTRARFYAVQDLTREKQRFANYLFLKCSGIAQDKDIANTSATTLALMERFETVDELAYADLDELTAFINEKGRNFADPAAKAKAIQTAARNSYRLPVTVNNSVNQAMAVSTATMRALEKQIKVLDKAIEQQFKIIPNTLTSIPGIGKVYSAGIIAEIGDINRFQSQASVAKFAGLVWTQHQSGEFEAQDRKLIKSGNRFLRYYLLEAANSVRRCDSEFRRYYALKFKEVNKHQHKRALALTAR